VGGVSEGDPFSASKELPLMGITATKMFHKLFFKATTYLKEGGVLKKNADFPQ